MNVGNLYPYGRKIFGAGLLGNDSDRAPVRSFFDVYIAVCSESAYGKKRGGGGDPSAVGYEALYFHGFVAANFYCVHCFGEVVSRVGGSASLVACKGERAESVARPAQANQTV